MAFVPEPESCPLRSECALNRLAFRGAGAHGDIVSLGGRLRLKFVDTGA